MTDCIFCKIVAGDIPSTKVYEDADVLAFMDVGPVCPGHTLVIPKQHVNPLYDMPDELLAKVMAVVRRVAKAQVAGLGADGVNLHQSNGAAAGQVVPHVHFHVIPRRADDGHSWNWTAGRYESPAMAAELAEKIRTSLEA